MLIIREKCTKPTRSVTPLMLIIHDKCTTPTRSVTPPFMLIIHDKCRLYWPLTTVCMLKHLQFLRGPVCLLEIKN